MLKLKAAPTFKAPVKIRAAGGEEHSVVFEFKHRTKDAMQAFMGSDEWRSQSDEDNVLAIACGWEGVDAEFSKDSLHELFQNYQAAPGAIMESYLSEMLLARAKN